MLRQNGIEWPQLDNRNLHMNLMSNNVSVGKDFGMKFYDIFDLLYDSTWDLSVVTKWKSKFMANDNDDDDDGIFGKFRQKTNLLLTLTHIIWIC